jgi:hypothetical protein
MRPVEKDITEKEQLTTGLEDVPVADASKMPRLEQLGQQQKIEVMEKTLICDVFAGYSVESGNARFDQTLMRTFAGIDPWGGFLRSASLAQRRLAFDSTRQVTSSPTTSSVISCTRPPRRTAASPSPSARTPSRLRRPSTTRID